MHKTISGVHKRSVGCTRGQWGAQDDQWGTQEVSGVHKTISGVHKRAAGCTRGQWDGQEISGYCTSQRRPGLARTLRATVAVHRQPVQHTHEKLIIVEM